MTCNSYRLLVKSNLVGVTVKPIEVCYSAGRSNGNLSSSLCLAMITQQTIFDHQQLNEERSKTSKCDQKLFRVKRQLYFSEQDQDPSASYSGDDCCPLVVDPLTLLALKAFIIAATYFLQGLRSFNVLINETR